MAQGDNLLNTVSSFNPYFVYCLWIICGFKATPLSTSSSLPGAVGLYGLEVKCGVPSRERDGNHTCSLFAHRCSHNRSWNLRSSFFLFVFERRQRKTVVWRLGRQGAVKHGEELRVSMFISPGKRINSLTRVLIFIPRNLDLGIWLLMNYQQVTFTWGRNEGLIQDEDSKTRPLISPLSLYPEGLWKNHYAVSGSWQLPGFPNSAKMATDLPSAYVITAGLGLCWLRPGIEFSVLSCQEREGTVNDRHLLWLSRWALSRLEV